MENIRPIRTEEDYDWALDDVTHYFENQPEPGTPDADRFDVLSELIGAYEDRHWPIEAPDPVEAISETIKSRGLKQADLAIVLGSKSRASESLSRKRSLNLSMIQKLWVTYKIPPTVLIQPYHLELSTGVKAAKKRSGQPKKQRA